MGLQVACIVDCRIHELSHAPFATAAQHQRSPRTETSAVAARTHRPAKGNDGIDSSTLVAQAGGLNAGWNQQRATFERRTLRRRCRRRCSLLPALCSLLAPSVLLASFVLSVQRRCGPIPYPRYTGSPLIVNSQRPCLADQLVSNSPEHTS